MTKVETFVELQLQMAKEQDVYGVVTENTTQQLTEISQTLSDEELNQAINLWTNAETYE
jgi:hypothetical protein